jgi:hypothetical protein
MTSTSTWPVGLDEGTRIAEPDTDLLWMIRHGLLNGAVWAWNRGHSNPEETT